MHASGLARSSAASRGTLSSDRRPRRRSAAPLYGWLEKPLVARRADPVARIPRAEELVADVPALSLGRGAERVEVIDERSREARRLVEREVTVVERVTRLARERRAARRGLGVDEPIAIP